MTSGGNYYHLSPHICAHVLCAGVRARYVFLRASPLLPSKRTGAIHHALLWDSGIQVFQLLFIRNKYTLFYCLGQRGNAGRKDAVQRDAVREDRRATRHCIIDENIV